VNGGAGGVAAAAQRQRLLDQAPSSARPQKRSVQRAAKLISAAQEQRLASQYDETGAVSQTLAGVAIRWVVVDQSVVFPFNLKVFL